MHILSYATMLHELISKEEEFQPLSLESTPSRRLLRRPPISYLIIYLVGGASASPT
jgi:hypothetical protein